jgi:hypothetical protein
MVEADGQSFELFVGDSVAEERDRLPEHVRRVQQEVYWADVDALAGRTDLVIERPYRPGEFYDETLPEDAPEDVVFAETVSVEVWLHDMFRDPARGVIRMRQPLPGPDVVITDGEDAVNWIVREGRR